MSRPRVLLFEHDPVLVSLLLQFLRCEGVEARPCGSITELRQRVAEDPEWLVLAASWRDTAQTELGLEERREIEDLGALAVGVILTTGRAWAAPVPPTFERGVTVLPKPYDLEELGEAIRAIWARGRS